MNINDKIYINSLLDFYEGLLTDRQNEILEMYYRKDYSMIEISTELNISKAAVSDIVKRTVKQLENYEKKLKNFHNYNQRMKLYGKLEMLDIKEILLIIKELKECE